ncbi:MAG: CAP domain-containing protein [Bacteroidetes bacterium]|nr:CAP domain-containing protein [Bacteroidota bacterium]
MKLPKLLPVMALIALLSFSCSTDSLEEDKIEALTSASYVPEAKVIEIEILELLNNHRLSIGLNPLNNMSTIKAQAYGHTDYMIDKSEVSHDGFLARKEALISYAGASRVGENVAYAYSSSESVVNAWINSDGHRHIIEGDYTDFDISAEKDANGKYYYTNIFIKK